MRYTRQLQYNCILSYSNSFDNIKDPVTSIDKTNIIFNLNIQSDILQIINMVRNSKGDQSGARWGSARVRFLVHFTNLVLLYFDSFQERV